MVGDCLSLRRPLLYAILESELGVWPDDKVARFGEQIYYWTQQNYLCNLDPSECVRIDAREITRGNIYMKWNL